MTGQTPPVSLIPAATILLVRDGREGIEVFMVKRHHQIDFASGALVFPGGKLAKGDGDPRLAAMHGGAGGFSAQMLPFAAAAIREAFEESGILLARHRDGRMLTAGELDALQTFRPMLDKGEMGLADFLERHALRLALEELAHFAHWITPVFMPKRFDTQFFIAAAPPGQLGRHDGSEAVDSVWITPEAAISDPSKWTVIFPTRMNLRALGRASSVATAMAHARAHTPYPVLPFIAEDGAGRKVLRLDPEAGYDAPDEPLEALAGVAR
ncbi:MAG: NUDIX hydrolase [Alphaproteobacteria bacterium]|nr:NUDIX hydrolase [Alphaproteobacteria bacterium]